MRAGARRLCARATPLRGRVWPHVRRRCAAVAVASVAAPTRAVRATVPVVRCVVRALATASAGTGGGAGSGHSGSSGGMGLKAVPFQLTAEQAREHVVQWQQSGWFGEDLTARLQRRELDTSAQFLPFYLFRSAVVDVRLKGSAQVMEWTHVWDDKSKTSRRVQRWHALSWAAPGRFGFGRTESVHGTRGRVAYDFERTPGLAVYAGEELPPHYVRDALRTTRIAQSLQPFSAELLATADRRDVEPFRAYPSAAWAHAHAQLRDIEAARALKWLRRAFPEYDDYRVGGDDVELVFDAAAASDQSGGGGGGVAHATRLVVVNGVDGGVGGAWQYSAGKVAGAVVAMHVAAAVMAPYLLKLPGFYVQMAALSAGAAAASQFVSHAALGYRKFVSRVLTRIRERLGITVETEWREWSARPEHDEQQQQQQQEHADSGYASGGRRNRFGRRAGSSSSNSSSRSSSAGGSSAPEGNSSTVLHYNMLGFTTPESQRAASLDDIKAAFRREALKNHPDHVPDAQRAAANERTRRVIEAYQHLRKLKSAYRATYGSDLP